MSNVIEGLNAIRELKARQAAAAAERDRPKANWISGKMADKPFVARFLQELDPENEFYREDRGVAVIAVEHVSPHDFKRRALCTIDSEGRCYACESYRAESDQIMRAKWRQKTNIYVQLLADFGEGPKVYVFSRNANTSFVDALLSELEDEENLTQANYRFTKTGEKTTTAYLLKRLKGEVLDDSNVETFPRESFIREVPYDKQAEFYGGEASEVQENRGESNAETDDLDW